MLSLSLTTGYFSTGMEIRNPLFPLPHVPGQTRQQRAPERGYEETAGQAVERDNRLPIPPAGGTNAAKPPLDYGELVRQARLQRVEETRGRATGTVENQTAGGLAINTYREQVRLGELDGVELLRFDDFA